MRDKDTQRLAVLRKLKAAGEKGVENVELNSICFRYGARIYELRHGITEDKVKHVIDKRNEGSGIFRFIYRGVVQPEQMRLIEARG